MPDRLIVIGTTLLALALLAGAAHAKVPQGNWPHIDGQVWVNESDHSGVHHGTDRNDDALLRWSKSGSRNRQCPRTPDAYGL